jgi:arylsulfatase A-like enzyme
LTRAAPTDSDVDSSGNGSGRPNVVLILADDLGYSDLGCYGGEIRTPNLDRLAHAGVRLTQFYNTARCAPSRSSLLTGLHPHQTGVGVLTTDESPTGYKGTLNDRCMTIAEVLQDAGYATGMSGKWHLTNDPDNVNEAWPTRRGFQRFFGTLNGCGSFYDPKTLTRGEETAEWEARAADFFYTDAITEEAVSFIKECGERPFFAYVAYTAPHFPLHAPEEDIRAYDAVYDAGWDELRQGRLRRLHESGVLPSDVLLSDRDPTQKAWVEEPHKAWQTRRMQVYAAQVERMDRGIGRIVDTLADLGHLDNTLILFLSDNGAESMALPVGDPERFRQRTGILRQKTRDGRTVAIGNSPDVIPGGEDTYASYGRAWANLSNTPFRYYKKWIHEGGIATPFIIHWPARALPSEGIVHEPFQLTDVFPTILEATESSYPRYKSGRAKLPLEGRSLFPVLEGRLSEPATLYWEHAGNAAVRRGRWKLVREFARDWELYDIESDRSELLNVAAENDSVVEELVHAWEEWAKRVGVVPFESSVQRYVNMGLDYESAVSCAVGDDTP